VTIAGWCRLLLLTKSVACRRKKGQINKHSHVRISAFYAYTDTGWYMFRTWWKRFSFNHNRCYFVAPLSLGFFFFPSESR